MATIPGTEGADTLNGTDQADLIDGKGGDDSLWGLEGDDVLSGGTGNDWLYGGPGADRLDGGGQRSVSWMQGLYSPESDRALYDSLGAPISLNLSTLQVSGAASGTDQLAGIEEVRGTSGADSVTGTLATRSPSASTFVNTLTWLGMGGSDVVVQLKAAYQHWVDGLFANYMWSNTPITVTSSGAVLSVSYGAASSTFLNSSLAQAAGTDSLTLVSALGDSRYADTINLSGINDNLYGSLRTYVSVTSGDDTVTGNGDTGLNIGANQLSSSTGKGVNFTLPGNGTSVLDMSHLTWLNGGGVNLGRVNVSKIDEIRGTELADTLTGGGYNDYEGFRGKGGDDLIDGGEGYDMADYLGASSGVHVNMAPGEAFATDSTNGSIGHDTLRSVEAIRGTNLGDFYDARGFGTTSTNVASRIFGVANGNSFEGRGGNDTVVGNGVTRIDYVGAAVGVDVDLVRGTAFAMGDLNSEAAKSVGVDNFSGVFRVRGSSLDDRLAGGTANVVVGGSSVEGFEPGPGNDTVDGREGWDEVYYQTGGWTSLRGIVVDMTLTDGPQVTEDGFGGKDTLIGVEFITGTPFNDSFKGSLTNAGLVSLTEAFMGSKGNDTLDGGAQGYDEAGYQDSPAAVVVNLATGSANDGWGTVDTLISIEGVEGSEYNDSVTGNAADNRLDGRSGNDTLDGGQGSDWAEYNSAPGAITVDLGVGISSGAAGSDVLISIENVQGTDYNDKLSGNSGDNIIEGQSGNDTLAGGDGNDSLYGSVGDDRLYGGAGSDRLDGGGPRIAAWLQGLPGNDYDTASYEDLSAPISLNLSTLQVSGTASGTDSLIGIEEVRGTNRSDSVSGTLTARAPSASNFQGNINWVGMGGSDSVAQAKSTYQHWGDGVYANYGWSNTPITVTANGSLLSVSYGTANGTFFNGAVAQVAGNDTLSLISSLGDTRYADHIDLSGLTENMYGTRLNYVSVSTGNDTVIGNGDTILNVSSGWRMSSSTGQGINFTLSSSNLVVLDLSHLSWQYSSSLTDPMGLVTVTGIEEIRATDFTDTLIGGAYDDFESFRGKGGDDFIDGRSGYDRADYMGSSSGVQVNLAAGSASALDSTNGSIGNDTLRSIEAIRGTNLGDIYDARGFGPGSANAGSGILGLAAGNSFDGRGGNDTITGNGATRLDYIGAAVGVDADLVRGTVFALGDLASEAAKSVGVDNFTGVFRLRGSSLGDKLSGGTTGAAYGSLSIEAFEPGAGDDTVDGRGGWDEVYYHTGGWAAQRGLVADMNIVGGPQVTEDGFGGKDTLIGIEFISGTSFDDTIKGSRSNDGLMNRTESFMGSKGNDSIDGGDQGYDEAAYLDSPAAVTVNLATGSASDGWGTTDALVNIEGVEGSEFNDSLTGSSGDNRLDGRGGNDTLDGGVGNDWAEYNNANGPVTVDLGASSASGAAGTDVLLNIENVQGSIHNDKLTGNAGDNILEGLDGHDSLYGGGGNDSLYGGEGNDRLYGQAGNDLLDGGPRRNTSWGTGTSGDYDLADYSAASAGLALNLQTLQVTGGDIGNDTLRGIEEVRATRYSDTVSGSLAKHTQDASDAQTGLTWIGLGGNDTLTQDEARYAYWADSAYVDYAWSGTAIQATATATGSAITVNYGNGNMFWYGFAQSAGADQLTRVSSLGDSLWADRIDLSGLTGNMHGNKRNYVNLSSGNDTLIGNGDTTLSLLASSTSASSQGNTGVSVTLLGAQTSSVDLSHLSWQPLSSSNDRSSGGLVSFSGVDEIRGTNFNDTLIGGGYDDYEGFRGRAGDDSIDGGSGYDVSDYLGSTAGVQVLLAQGRASSLVEGDLSIGVDTLRSIEAIRGTNFNDVFDARGFGLSGAANQGSTVFSLIEGNSFEGRGGNDQILGNGSTRIDYQGAAVGVNVDLARGSAYALGDTSAEVAKSVGFDSFTGVFRVRGSSFGDLLVGGSAGRAYGSVWIEGFQPGPGNDTVDGKDGWDEVYYGDGSERGLVIDLSLSSGPQVTEDGHGGQDQLIGIEYIGGTEFADRIKGSFDNAGLLNATESFGGGKGNDTLDGGAGGYDEVSYGNDPKGVTVNLATGTATDGWDNTDTLISIEGVEGSRFNDRITGNAADNRLDGRDGDDTLNGGEGSDWAEYNNANSGWGVFVDLAQGKAAASSDLSLAGGQGLDTLINIENVQGTIYGDGLRGDGKANILQGMAGDDTLDGGSGNDTLLGGDGHDWLRGEAGDDSIDGGGGSDMLFYDQASAGIVADLVSGIVSDGQGGTDRVSNVENLLATNFADRVTLGASEGFVIGRAGNDTLIGGTGDQTFEPGSGSDSIDGGGGTDAVNYNDSGSDPASRTTVASGVIVNLLLGTALDNWGSQDMLAGIENVVGSQLGDLVIGNLFNNALDGGDGNDTLDGNDGNDALWGRGGNDTLEGGSGWDSAFFMGPKGNYQINFNGPNGSVIVTDLFTSDGDEGVDTLTNMEQLVFSDTAISAVPDSSFNGDELDNILVGTAGKNQLNGLGGNDWLQGKGGADTLVGGPGNDTLDGGVMTDFVTGTDGNTANYYSSPNGVTVNLQTGVALDGYGDTDTLIDISTVVGTAYDDVLIGTTARGLSEVFLPGRGNDTIDGGAIGPNARGVEGNSVTYWESNNTDPLLTSGVQVDLKAGTATSSYYGNDVLRNIQSVSGTRFADLLLGDDDDYLEIFQPIYGNDTIDGRGGSNNNVAYYWAIGPITGNLALGWVQEYLADGVTLNSTDTIYNIQGLRGGNHSDLLIGGNSANDGFERYLGGKGNDTIDGGSGYDRVDHHTSPAAVRVELGGRYDGKVYDGFGTVDTLRNIEGASGSMYADTLLGSDDAPFESFEGLWGNDTIDGRGGIDRLDLLRSGAPVTVVLGLNGGDGYALDGNIDSLTGTSGRDLIRGIEQVRASIFDDLVTGNEQANLLEGLAGKDTMQGGAGNDTLAGGEGDDSIHGGEGEDTVVFKGLRSSYTESRDAVSNTWTVAGPEGSDLLAHVEFLQFDDQLVNLKPDNTAPKLLGQSPSPSASNVAIDSNVVLQFDEPIALGNGNISLSYGSTTLQIPANSTQLSVIGQSLIINPEQNLPQGATVSLSLPAGMVTDLAGNAAAALASYSFTTAKEEVLAPTQVMLDMRNLKLQNNLASSSANLSFDLVLAADSYGGSRISGLVIDLDYDASLVKSARVLGNQYISNEDKVGSWSYIVPNLSGTDAKGKIAMVARTDPDNPLRDANGAVASVTLVLNKTFSANESFALSFAAGKTQVITENSVTSTVATGAAQTVQGSDNYQGLVSTKLLGNKALGGVSFARSDAGDAFSSAADGTGSFQASSDQIVTVTPTRPLSAQEQSQANDAVNLADAIAILKMIVGLNINGTQPATPYQVLAADFNQNGNVGLDDAIGVLKHVVGLAAPTPALRFADAQAMPTHLDLDAYNGDAVKTQGSNWLSGKIQVDVTQSTPVQVVGVLAGDVNGEWAPQ